MISLRLMPYCQPKGIGLLCAHDPMIIAAAGSVSICSIVSLTRLSSGRAAKLEKVVCKVGIIAIKVIRCHPYPQYRLVCSASNMKDNIALLLLIHAPWASHYTIPVGDYTYM